MFKVDGFFLGTVSEIRIGAKNNKNRRCIYNDGDCEDFSLKQIQTLSRLYPLPRYFKKIEPTIEYDIDNIPLDSTVKTCLNHPIHLPIPILRLNTRNLIYWIITYPLSPKMCRV